MLRTSVSSLANITNNTGTWNLIIWNGIGLFIHGLKIHQDFRVSKPSLVVFFYYVISFTEQYVNIFNMKIYWLSIQRKPFVLPLFIPFSSFASLFFVTCSSFRLSILLPLGTWGVCHAKVSLVCVATWDTGGFWKNQIWTEGTPNFIWKSW